MSEPLQDMTQWRRASKIAIVYYVLQFVKHLVGQFIYLIPAFIALGNLFTNNPFLVTPVSFGVVALISISGLLNYYFFRFRVVDGAIEIRSGVFVRKQLNLPYSRIQNLKFEQPLYYRFTDHVVVELDTAGSSKNEAKLAALFRPLAESLKHEVMATRMRSEPESSDTSTAISDRDLTEETLIIDRSLIDLIIHGLTNNRVWIILGAAAPVFDDIADNLGGIIQHLGIDSNQWFSLESNGWLGVTVAVITTFVVIMMLLSMLSVLGSIITYYDFKLTRLGDRYVRRSGLFTKREVAMPLKRLQLVSVRQDWLDRLLKRANVHYEQIGSQHQQHPNHPNAQQKLMVPSVRLEEINELVSDVLDSPQFDQRPYQPIHHRYLVRMIAFFAIPVALISSAIVWLNTESAVVASGVFLGIVSFLGGVFFQRWRRWGVDLDAKYVAVKSGFIGVSQRLFERHKIQQITVSQSWFMKRHNLFDLSIVLASGSIKVPCLRAEDALALRDSCLLTVERDGKSWM